MAKRKRPSNAGKKYWKSQLALNNLIQRLPHILSGKERRRGKAERRLYNAWWSTCIQRLFVELHHAYETKSRFGTDDNGDRWDPNHKTTLAYKRRDQSRKNLSPNQKRKLDNPDTPGLLSPSQYRQWRKTFMKVYTKELKKSKGRGRKSPSTLLSPGKYKKFSKTAGKNEPSGLTDKEIKAKAASVAWAEAKSKGAETLLDVLGTQPSSIMKVTGTLMDSLRPGKVTKDFKYIKSNRYQVVRLSGGEVFIGTKVPYARFASRTIPPGKGRYARKAFSVKREFLPEDLGVFYDRALEAANAACMEELKRLVEENEHLK
jgi:hypothetical protein